MTDSLNNRHGHLNLSQSYKQPPINGHTNKNVSYEYIYF